MTKPLLALTILMATTSAAQAGDFLCVGTGRFATIEKKAFAIAIESKDDHKKLLETTAGEIQVSLEKTDEAGGPYLMIDAVDLDNAGGTAYHGAKGLASGTVMYIDSPESLIKCTPVKQAEPTAASPSL